MSRKTARAAAMQLIFERVSGGQGGEETLNMVYEELRENGAPDGVPVAEGEPNRDDRAYIAEAFDGVLSHREELDQLIEQTARGWSLARMSLVDLTILRLAVWEMLYAPAVPDSVAIAEALELTERYSDPDDKSFINGVLGSIQRKKEAEAAEAKS